MNDFPRLDPTKFEDPLSDYEPIQYGSELERALAEETVDQMQTRPFAQVTPTTTVREAVQLLHASQVASVLVVDEAGTLIGLFTERDVLERVAERYDRVASSPVSDVMTSNPTVVYETDPAAAAIAAIAVAGHRHVPVLNMDGSVMGLISPRRAFDFIEKHQDRQGGEANS